MKKNLSKLLLLFPLLFLTSQTAFADMAMTYHPLERPIFNIVLLLVISLVEVLFIKFGLKIKFWKSLWTLIVANLVTAIIGVMFFEEFLTDFHSHLINLSLFLQVFVIFLATWLIESGILGLLIKGVNFRRLFFWAFFANLASYLILILIINIPYIL